MRARLRQKRPVTKTMRPHTPTPRPTPDRSPDGGHTHQQLVDGGGGGRVAARAGHVRGGARKKRPGGGAPRDVERTTHTNAGSSEIFWSHRTTPPPSSLFIPGPSFSKPRHLILHNDSTGCTQTPAGGAAALTPDDLARPRPNTWAEEAVAVVTMLLFFR